MLDKQDDGAEYREAVPLREAVVVAGPETDAAGDSQHRVGSNLTRVADAC
jgi:hypothetical protein